MTTGRINQVSWVSLLLKRDREVSSSAAKLDRTKVSSRKSQRYLVVAPLLITHRTAAKLERGLTSQSSFEALLLREALDFTLASVG